MVRLKRTWLFGLLILTVILISGCINSNEPTQKTQQTDEPKVINLNAKQIILDDNEIEDLFGVILTKDETIIPESDELPVNYSVHYDIHSVHILSGVDNVYVLKKSDNNKYNVSIGVYVFPTIDDAKYFEPKIIDSDQNIKVIKNIINIGNTSGNLDSVVSIAPLFSWSNYCDFNNTFTTTFLDSNYGRPMSYSCVQNNDKSINIEYNVINQDTYLFDFNEVPGKDNDKFINFLKKQYKIDWIDTAKIEKINENTTIRVFNGGKFLELHLEKVSGCLLCAGARLNINDEYQDYFNVETIGESRTWQDGSPVYVTPEKRDIYKYVRNNFSLILNDEKTKVNLKTYDGRFNDEFDVKKEDNTLNVYKQSKLLSDLNVGDSVIMFSKNNIMIIVRSNPDVKIETLLELAKKQDEKISRILDMIQ